eukprot:s2754_g14.t1
MAFSNLQLGRPKPWKFCVAGIMALGDMHGLALTALGWLLPAMVPRVADAAFTALGWLLSAVVACDGTVFCVADRRGTRSNRRRFRVEPVALTGLTLVARLIGRGRL